MTYVIEVSDEVIDLVATAALVSRHASEAYKLLQRECDDAIPSLSVRQRIIADRKAGSQR